MTEDNAQTLIEQMINRATAFPDSGPNCSTIVRESHFYANIGNYAIPQPLAG
jgi:hypothetical protein